MNLLYFKRETRVLSPEACRGTFVIRRFLTGIYRVKNVLYAVWKNGNTEPLTMFNPRYQVWTSIVVELFSVG